MKNKFNINRKVSYFFFSFLLLATNALIATNNQKNDSTIHSKDSIVRHDNYSCGMNIRTIRTTPELNPGLITSFDQAISGKIAGVQISTNSGSILSEGNIQILGISSLFNSSQPLIVIDGIPLETAYSSTNLANILNPDDIESISVLKDAAFNGIYGMRASNGVISISTKKGQSDKLRINFSSTNAVQQVSKTVDVLSAADFRNLINTQGSDAEKALLGNASTKWSNEIFQTALVTNNHIGISGGLAKNIPFRVSIGYLNQDGTLKTEHLDRISGSLVINPSLFNNHLNLSINLRGSINKNQIADKGAIWSASYFNPTNPVTTNDPFYIQNFGGYWQSYTKYDNTIYPSSINNPVALLNQSDDKQNSNSYLENIGIDYKFHFFENLHMYINYGNYNSVTTENKNVSTSSPINSFHGLIQTSSQLMDIENLQAGFTFYKSLNKHNIYASINYESILYQSNYDFNSTYFDGSNQYVQETKSTSSFVSYFAQIKYNYAEKYFLTLNSRVDGSSRFSTSNRWGNAPCIGFVWNTTQEDFMENQTINQLNVKINYGFSGQLYNNTSTAYIPNLKWESTKTLNYGIDFGLYNNRITGSIDFYNRTTEDLLSYSSVPSGSNSYQTISVNKGTLTSSGGELTINVIPVMTNKIVWSICLNASYQQSTLNNYSTNGFTTPLDFLGNVFTLNKDGYPPALYYVLKQKYDSKGKPIEGSYYDLNGDGKIDYNDRYADHSAAPDCLLGLNSLLTYGKWSAGISFRASIGNYIYNQTNAKLGCYQQPTSLGYLRNISTDYLNTDFKIANFESDYYVENASFLKMDYLNVGYDFGEIAKKIKLKLTATVQNVLTITGYKGVDPEIPNGVDYGFYPRPRIFSVKMNLDF